MKNFVIACLLALGAGTAPAQDLDKPVLLVASPQLHGKFGRTVVVALPAGDGGEHVGFIVNRTTGMSLASMFPDHAPSVKVKEPVHLGGPEMTEMLYTAVRKDPGQPSTMLLEGVYIVTNASLIDQIIEQTPNDARYFVGFVRWAPGELAKEVNDGWWKLDRPTSDIVFRGGEGVDLWYELAGPAKVRT